MALPAGLTAIIPGQPGDPRSCYLCSFICTITHLVPEHWRSGHTQQQAGMAALKTPRGYAKTDTQLHIMTFRNDVGLGMLFWWECDVYNLARKWILGPRNVTRLISIYVARTKPWVQSLTPYKSDIVACVHHPSTQEEDAGGSEVQGSFGAQDSLGSMRPGQKGWEMKKEKRRERKGRKEDQWENRMRYIPSNLKQRYSQPQEKQI